MSNPSEQPSSPGKVIPPPQGPTPTPAKTGGSFFWWLVLIVLLGGGSYAYLQGWLDQSIAAITKVQTASSTPASKTSKTTSTVRTAPAPLENSKLSGGALTQLEAIQSRLIKLENDIGQLQKISETHAEQIARQTGDLTIAQASPVDLSELEMQLIDLRLRLDGDTHAAISKLETLAESVPKNSDLLPLLTANRTRLASVPTRTDILSLYRELADAIVQARNNVNTHLQELQTTSATSGSVFETLFSVRKDDSKVRAELTLIEELQAAVPPVRMALMQNHDDDYILALRQLRNVADKLNASFPTAYSITIAKVLAQLHNIGAPDASLILFVPTN